MHLHHRPLLHHRQSASRLSARLSEMGEKKSHRSDSHTSLPPAQSVRPKCKEESANFLSRIFLTWTFPLIYQGWKKPLQDEDLWELRDHERGICTTTNLIQTWQLQQSNPSRKKSMYSALLHNQRSTLIVTGILKALEVTLLLLQPVFVNQLLRFLPQPDRPASVGIAWSIALFVTPLIRAVVENNYFFRTMRSGMQVRSALQGTIYDKSLRMSPSARASSSLGEIVNLMQLDTQRIADFFQWTHVLWASPVQIIVSVVLLFIYIEWSAIIGLAITLLSLPLQSYLFRQQIKLRRASIGITDRRVKLMNEILQGIKAVKFYAWEKPFAAAVDKEREDEISKLSSTIWVRAATVAIMMSVPIVIAVITFSFFTGVFKQRLDPAKIFTGIALLNQLRFPVMMLPMTINALIDARIGLKRIERFLDLEDTDNYHRDTTGGKPKQDVVEEQLKPDVEDDITRKVVSTGSSSSNSQDFGSITIQDGEFEWSKIVQEPVERKKKAGVLSCFGKKKESPKKPADSKQEKPVEEEDQLKSYESTRGSVLQNISLKASGGELTAVVGRVGSGKSSLFHAILGEMRKVHGKVAVTGSIAYVAQTAWIFNDTLRNNIIFGKDFDEELYKVALEVSALEPDIAILPAGDQTAIGEKGINLSGGQKQRVSIARAVYADADIYLFDDPLSALDSHVSREVFSKCISNTGILNDKLRILVTNQVHVLPECDNIIFLESGSVRCEGSYTELASTDSSFQQLINEQEKNEKGAEEATNQDTSVELVDGVDNLASAKTAALSMANANPVTDVSAKKKQVAGQSLMQEEERNEGSVVGSAYIQYARACGGIFMFILLLLFFAITVALSVIVSWWLAYWAEEERNGIENLSDVRSIGFFLGIYFALALGFAAMSFIRGVWFLNLALHASKGLHDKMLTSVLHAPMAFFDTTPIGRIISRFSRDVNALDETLPQYFQQMLSTVLNLVASYVFIGTVLPIFFAAAVPAIGIYALLQRFFHRTALELKRLDSISKSPIYAHFSETLGGLSTLRAYGKQNASRAENMKMIDINQRAYFAYIACNRWFSLYLEITGSLVIFATSIFSVVYRNSIFSGRIGLTLTYALQVTGILGFTVRSITELEGQMTSVERANYYSHDLPQERPSVIEYEEGKGPGTEWPESGQIEVNDVHMRYREGLDLVLKGVNLSIKGGEKIGIVGRTGSGKSSMMIALLRMVEVCDGSIVIDGLNLSELGLDDIRKKITIIPQDPVVFSGTIRFNLDPFSEHTDVELWEALEKSHMKQFVSESEGGLDAVVSEYGENLSAGQRQVICLTRAILRNSKILILDEASSSLDMETDRLLQETIRIHMKGATILTIAHRLFTLADYDRVVVMDNGVAAEFDSPQALLDRPSLFRDLVDAMGEAGSQRFREMVASR